MRRRLKHRIPVRLRHHWRVVAACGAFPAVLIGLVGAARVTPLVTSDARTDTSVVTEDVAGSVDLFDAGKPHTLTLSYSEDDYQRMLDQYWEDGEKEYVEADLVIDATAVPSVGIRLKGNSTLSGLTRNGERAPNRGFGGGQRTGMPGGGPPAGMRDGGMARGGGGPGGTLKAEEPENLPWLISFDEYAEGRRYQGRAEIAVRPAGRGASTGLAEAVALSLVATAGDPTQRYAYSSFAVNDRPTVARLVVEHPDAGYADDLVGDGVLYKSRASSQFTDQGDDPTDYQDDFDQINLKRSQDLQPVIDLIKWVSAVSDEEFAAGLADRIDVPAFARYVALQNLLLNFDDMSGPGRNYYLYYDLDSRRFTVLTWDFNLALSGDPAQGPHDEVRMGGFRLPTDGQQQGTRDAPGPQDAPGGQGRPAGGFAQGHPLKQRFLKTTAFTAGYEEAYRSLYQRLFASGAALRAVDQISAAAKRAGASSSTVDSEAAGLRTLIKNRTTSLATNEVIAKG